MKRERKKIKQQCKPRTKTVLNTVRAVGTSLREMRRRLTVNDKDHRQR